MLMGVLLRRAVASVSRRSPAYCYPRFLHSHVPCCSASVQTHPEADALPLNRWHVFAQVCLERYPILAAEMTPLEREYQELCDRIDFERSYLSDHELWVDKTNRKQREDLEDDRKPDEGLLTPQDYQDSRDAELKQYLKVQADRQTEADSTGAKDTLHRALDKTLVMAVRQVFGEKVRLWHLPSVRRAQGETMRQTCERLLASMLPSDNSVKCQMLGYAPIAVYVKHYPKRTQAQIQVTGAKMFVYKARVVDYAPHAIFKPACAEVKFREVQWLTHEEFLSVTSKNFSKVLRPILFNV